MLITLLSLLLSSAPAQPRQPLVVVSVDGLDYRYLRDRDALGLKIPTIRRLLAEGEFAQGVIGVLPTITWPSHTTLITGVAPARHGILGNRRPKADGGEYYWSASLLKVRTLWQAAHSAGLKSAAITWPVTVDAEIDYNLPEYFQRRNGGAMDLESIESKGTPGLVAEIAARHPSFAQQWMDDRTRTLAAIDILEHKKPDLLLLHLVDLDAEQHERGPFTRESKAILEYTDELLGRIMSAMPGQAVLALVSDHGFERIDRVAHVPGVIEIGGAVAARDEATAARLRERPAEYSIGREIPMAEFRQFAPGVPGVVAAFEPAEHVMFGPADGKPREIGVHGLWPARPDYRSVFLLWGRGIRPRMLPEMNMLDIAPRLASILGTPLK